MRSSQAKRRFAVLISLRGFGSLSGAERTDLTTDLRERHAMTAVPYLTVT